MKLLLKSLWNTESSKDRFIVSMNENAQSIVFFNSRSSYNKTLHWKTDALMLTQSAIMKGCIQLKIQCKNVLCKALA